MTGQPMTDFTKIRLLKLIGLKNCGVFIEFISLNLGHGLFKLFLRAGWLFVGVDGVDDVDGKNKGGWLR